MRLSRLVKIWWVQSGGGERKRLAWSRGWARAGGLGTGGPRATSPLSTSLTRTRAARTSCTPYGDRFSAMAARSVGVHLSAGASLTWAERGAGL
jgi:hypothetical protein